MTTHRTVIDIRLENDAGDVLQMVPVELTYLVEVDHSYGSDADGRRGVRTEEVYILDQAIAPRYLMKLSVDQIEYVLDRAIKTVTEGGMRNHA